MISLSPLSGVAVLLDDLSPLGEMGMVVRSTCSDILKSDTGIRREECEWRNKVEIYGWLMEWRNRV